MRPSRMVGPERLTAGELVLPAGFAVAAWHRPASLYKGRKSRSPGREFRAMTMPAVKRVLPNVDHRRHKRLNNPA